MVEGEGQPFRRGRIRYRRLARLCPFPDRSREGSEFRPGPTGACPKLVRAGRRERDGDADNPESSPDVRRAHPLKPRTAEGPARGASARGEEACVLDSSVFARFPFGSVAWGSQAVRERTGSGSSSRGVPADLRPSVSAAAVSSAVPPAAASWFPRPDSVSGASVSRDVSATPQACVPSCNRGSSSFT